MSTPIASRPELPDTILRQEMSPELPALANAKEREITDRLPDELLIHIFVDFTYVLRDGQVIQRHFRKRLGTLMRTCRRWRNIVVSTPEFWCHVDLIRNRIDWLQLCLARSRSAPIDVAAYLPSYGRNPVPITLVYPHVHHFRSLSLHPHPGTHHVEDVSAALHALCDKGMPVLEDLNITVYGMPVLLPQLTSQGFPRLQKLTLLRMGAPQDTSLYSQLRTLSLHTCSHTLSFDAFLDALASCALLEELDLFKTLDGLSDDWTRRVSIPRRPLISFPRLRRLVSHGHSAVCTSRFLASLHIHSSTDISITAMEANAAAGAMSPHTIANTILTILPPNQPAATIEPLTTASRLCLTPYPRMVEIAGYKHAEPAPGTLRTESPSLSIKWNCLRLLRRPLPKVHGLDELVHACGRSPATKIFINGLHHDHATVASWARLFSAFPLLETLSVHSTHSSASAAAITNLFLGLREADSGPQVACPHLKTIRVNGGDSEGVYDAVRECIRHRGDKGAILEELDLRELYDWGRDVPSAVCRRCVKDIESYVSQIYLARHD